MFQQGFREQCGSITAAFAVKESISYYIEKNSKVFAAFLDNQKAFNSVWINGLLFKLYELGVSGKIWRLLRDSFENVYSQVLFAGQKGDKFPIIQGVGQGRVLSAWLFLVVIDGLAYTLDDLQQGLRIDKLHVPCILLADDTMIMSPTISTLQTQLEAVYRNSCKWRLAYNSNKSTLIEFSRKKSVVNNKETLNIGNDVIVWSDSKVYAGITLCRDLKENTSIHENCEKGKRSMNSITDIGIYKGGVNPVKSIEVVKRVIFPSILYGAELWNDVNESSKA